MNKRYLLMIGVAAGAALLGRKLYQIRQKSNRNQAGDNTVDLTSEDSFPASDSPSWTPVSATGT
jgi:hypothetical protein